jgi:hypothetical protein
MHQQGCGHADDSSLLMDVGATGAAISTKVNSPKAWIPIVIFSGNALTRHLDRCLSSERPRNGPFRKDAAAIDAYFYCEIVSRVPP